MGPEEAKFEALPPPPYPRKEVIDELFNALRKGQSLMHHGAWARATTEVCLAMLEAAHTAQSVALQHQVPVQNGH
jgi:phthalate 4,5-cis-dihydrodiol dehydrogenase